MSVNPLSEEARKQRAQSLLNQGRLEDARQTLEELCDDLQQDVEIWSLYATANGHLGRYEDVISACQKTLEIEPDYLPALNGLASALAALGRFEEADTRFKQLMELAPDNPAVLNNYAHTLVLMERKDDACKVLEDAVRIQPHYAEARYNLAILLEQAGKTERALQEYEQAASMKPGLPGIEDRVKQLRDAID